MKNIPILLIFILFSIAKVYSQVNTETLRKSDLEEGWHNTISLNFGLNKGNSNFVTVNAGLRSDYRKDRFYSFLSSSVEYKEGNDKLISSKGFAHLRGIYTLTELLHPEIFIQKQYNKFIFLKDRNLAGGGMRLLLVNRRYEKDSVSKLRLYLGIGAMYENEVFIKDIAQETHLLRSTNYVNFRWIIDPRLQVQFTSYFQFDTGRFHDCRVLSESTLSFSITEALKFSVSVNYRFDNEPPKDIKKYDLEVLNGISVLF